MGEPSINHSMSVDDNINQVREQSKLELVAHQHVHLQRRRCVDLRARSGREGRERKRKRGQGTSAIRACGSACLQLLL